MKLRIGRGSSLGWCIGAALLLIADIARALELEPRAFSPSPIGTTFILGGVGHSKGGILFDPALDLDKVQADLWIATIGAGYTFALAGRQAKVLAVVPVAWGTVSGDVHDQTERQALAGLVDPRFKLSVGVTGAPALTFAEFARAPRHTRTPSLRSKDTPATRCRAAGGSRSMRRGFPAEKPASIGSPTRSAAEHSCGRNAVGPNRWPAVDQVSVQHLIRHSAAALDTRS